MALRLFPLIAREGWPLLAAVLVSAIVAARLGGPLLVAPFAVLMILLVLLFRDPPRTIPSEPLAIVSPVDGRVLSVEPTDKGSLRREAMRVVIRVNHYGAYTARCPVEGKVLNLQDNAADGSRLLGKSGLWIRTDEGDDVVLLTHGPGRFGQPRAFVRYGERVGQGKRFAFIRLTTRFELLLPLTCIIQVQPGDRVLSGVTPVAMLVHR